MRTVRYSLNAMIRLSATGLTLAIFTLACSGGGGSPTAPGLTVATGLEIVFKSDRFGPLEPTIAQHIRETFERVRRDLDIDGLKVTIEANGQGMIPGWQMGGSAFSPGKLVEMTIDPAIPPSLLDERLPSLLAHEFHHIARHRGEGYGDTLLKAMVSEGLADTYAWELFGGPVHPWTVALSNAEQAFWLDRARPELDSRSYSHSHWFFGRGVQPNWTGYTLGFEAIREYIEAYPGETATSLVNASAELFRP